MKILKVGLVSIALPEWPAGQYMECLNCKAKLELEDGDPTEAVTGNSAPKGSVVARCIICGGVTVGGDFRGQEGIDRNIQRTG